MIWASLWAIFYRKFFWDFVYVRGDLAATMAHSTCPATAGSDQMESCEPGPPQRKRRHLTTPGSPSTLSRPFLAIVVRVPLLQLVTLAMGAFAFALEWSLVSPRGGGGSSADGDVAQLEGTFVHRSIPFRMTLYLAAAIVGVLVYQVRRATDGRCLCRLI